MAGPNVQRLYQLIKQFNLDAVLVDKYRPIVALIEQGCMPEDYAEVCLLIIGQDIEYAKRNPNYLRTPPTREELHADGPPDVELGHLVNSPKVRFGLRYRERPRSALCAGSSGSGKTTAIRGFIEKTYRLGQTDPSRKISFIVFDAKGDYAHLPSTYGPDWIQLNVQDPRTRLPLIAPQGVAPQIAINYIASCFSARAGLIAAWGCFANLFRWILAVLNPPQAPFIRWPSLRLILQIAKAVNLEIFASKPEYAKSLFQALDTATQAMQLFDCFGGGLDVDRDIIGAGKNLVLAMPNVEPTWIRRFIIDLILSSVLISRMQRNLKVDRTEICFILDEADKDASQDADEQYPDSMSPLATVLRMGREFGIMVVIGLAELQRASRYVLSEPPYHFIFTQTDSVSIARAAQTLLLPRGAELMLPGLRNGQCIYREAQGPYPFPLLGQCDYLPAARSALPINTVNLPFLPHQDLSELPELQAAVDKLMAEHRANRIRQNKANAEQPGISKQAGHNLCHTIATHPWAPAQVLWQATGHIPSPATQKAVRKELALALAESEEARLGSANILLYRLTDTGWKYLGRTPPTHQGRGSICHQHICHWIEIDAIRQGFQAVCEWTPPDTNHSTDCAIQIAPDLWDVFEVCVSQTDNLLKHFNALIQSRYVRNITVVCLQKRFLNDLQKKLLDEPVVRALGGRLTWALAETYLRKAFP